LLLCCSALTSGEEVKENLLVTFGLVAFQFPKWRCSWLLQEIVYEFESLSGVTVFKNLWFMNFILIKDYFEDDNELFMVSIYFLQQVET
jgi:hypothetical protein